MSREGDFYEAGGVTTEMRREMEPSGRLGHVGAGPLRQEVIVGDLRNAERNLMAEIEGAKREAEAREGEG